MVQLNEGGFIPLGGRIEILISPYFSINIPIFSKMNKSTCIIEKARIEKIDVHYATNKTAPR